MLHTREHLPCTPGTRRAARAPCAACRQPRAPRPKIHLGMADLHNRLHGAGFMVSKPSSQTCSKLSSLLVCWEGGCWRAAPRAWLGSRGENLACWIHPCLSVRVNSLWGRDTEFLLLSGVSVCETRSFEQELKHLVCLFEYF